MFRWDPETNRLSLQPGQSPPWIRQLNRVSADSPKSWVYCNECGAHLFSTGKKVYGHIPFRDKASQGNMKRPAKKEPVETQEEPEIEPAVDSQPAAPAAESDLVEDDDEDEGGAAEEQQGAEDPPDDDDRAEMPQQKWPTLEEYQEKWDRLKAYHCRANEGGFSRDNLVPDPIPQLWSDCPIADGCN